MRVGILNAGGGSVFSLANALRLLDVEVVSITKPDELSELNRVILPGVGHFDTGAAFIGKIDWKASIDQYLSNDKNRLLGICLGMQLMFLDSDESSAQASGLGLIQEHCKKLSSSETWKVPNVGWRSLEISGSNIDFFADVDIGQSFYFVHSYAVLPQDMSSLSEGLDEYAITLHSNSPFLSAFRKANIYGCQFHPEKSSSSGIALLSRFIN